MPRICLLPWWLTSTSLSGSINPSSPLHGAIWRRENNRGSECGKIVKVCCLARFLPGFLPSQSAIPMQKFVGGNSPSRKFRDIQSCLVNWWRHTQISTWGQIRLCANPLLNARFTQIPWLSINSHCVLMTIWMMITGNHEGDEQKRANSKGERKSRSLLPLARGHYYYSKTRPLRSSVFVVPIQWLP